MWGSTFRSKPYNLIAESGDVTLHQPSQSIDIVNRTAVPQITSVFGHSDTTGFSRVVASSST
jgi:hypothetical protein